MAVTVYTENEFLERAISALSTNLPGRATHPLSFLGQEARSCAQLLSEIQKSIADADRDSVPAIENLNGIIRSRCSSERLNQWAEFFGLESNRGAGVYGRNIETAATGGGATAGGTPGTIVAINSQLTDPSGTIVIKLVQGVTVGAGGTVGVTLAAITKGATGNLPAGTRLTWQSPPVGLNPTLVLTTPLSKGAAQESDLDLVLRLLRRMQLPPKGGTANDYQTWTLAATDTDGSSLGIDAAYIFPRRNGDGSVDVVATVPGYGQNRDPGATILAKLLNVLKAKKIATDTVRVFGPRFVTGEAILITVYHAVPKSSAYRWHWDDSSSLTVFSDCSTTSLIVTGATLPASLKAAVTAGAKPMLQALVPSYSPVPLVPRVTAYQENTPAGKCTLTLEAAPLATIPAATLVYAGSAAVVPVCTAVAAYVNQLGPSIQSGFNDPLTTWESKLTVGRVAQSVIDARDADGSQPIVYSLNVGLGASTGIVLRYSGSNSLADYDLFDNDPATGPQFALLSGVILRQ